MYYNDFRDVTGLRYNSAAEYDLFYIGHVFSHNSRPYSLRSVSAMESSATLAVFQIWRE